MNSQQLDRACGAVLGAAAGDALGAGYEFDCATVGPDGPQMIGGGLGNFAPGEWTDDTTMAWCILEAAADPTTHDLRSDATLDRIARNFRDWYATNPPDIGNQTRTVLRQAGENPTGATMVATAYDLHQRTGHTGGNGSLMRTNPVAVAHLDDATAAAEAARRISDLTHYDPDAGDACVLWTLAIRHAILTGELDVRVGLPHLTPEAAKRWTHLIDEAEACDPKSFSRNGWVVGAFQAAWSAIVHTPVPDGTNPDAGMPCAHLPAALATAIGIGHDTDTVAAIAGGLLGARWGASAVPAKWRRLLHGYPGISGERLVDLATLAARGGKPLANGWPSVQRMDYTAYTGGHVLVRHPHDDGVWLGDVDALDALEDHAVHVTAVVS
ncbi:MAG TPA: ADP-ribosylglycohydrolase family protein, partial [Phycicoccus sp.]|nr:ADP-ribosylglycohydrolase family protein [Phycicoccus sp.]